jgi:diguanylate cyclase (GGDEF)-like protein
MSDIDGLLQRHQCALCLPLSLVVGVISLLEPLTARFGGDEFVLLLPGLDAARAAEVAQRLLREARESAELQSWHALAAVTLSIGLATYPAHGSRLSELPETADTALLQAKAHGKNCVMTAAAPATSAATSA